MIRCRGGARHGTSWASASSVPPRHLSNISRFLKHCWMVAATIMAMAPAAQGIEDFGAAAVAEVATALDGGGGRGLGQGAGITVVAAEGSSGRGIQGVSESADQCNVSPALSNQVDPENYEFGCKEIEEMLHGRTSLVGHGRIRDVYLVEYKDQVVVLKTLRETGDPRRQKAHFSMHRREALSLDAVRGHPNVVGMLGVCNSTLVTEYYSIHFDQVILRQQMKFPIDKMVSMALDAARGLQALHEASASPIVHFDLKPQQLLMDETGRVLVNDLNMAQFMDLNANGRSCPFLINSPIKAVGWRAPESIAGKPMTEKVDIYGMGMIFYTLISGKTPFPKSEMAAGMIMRGERPYVDPSWHEGYMQVVKDMWKWDPEARPSARQVVQRLEDVQDSLPA